MNGFSSTTRRSKATPLEPVIQPERLIDSAILAAHGYTWPVLCCTKVWQPMSALGQETNGRAAIQLPNHRQQLSRAVVL
jgi:hypothetical protein